LVIAKIFGNNEPIKVDVGEAYILWRLLTNRYVYIGHVQQLKNFTHDKDFNVILSNLLNDWRKEVSILEPELEKYSLKGAEPPAIGQDVPGNSEVVIDRETAEVIYAFLRLDVHLILLALKDANVNDSIGKLLQGFLSRSLDRVDSYIGYLKMKNWVYYPPLYPYVKAEVTEKIACNEVFLLWDHLVFRYNKIRKTQMYAEMTSDADFKMMLLSGLDILKKQMNELQQKLMYFGITLPKPYSNIRPVFTIMEPVENKFMYADTLRGMQNALALHGAAIQDVILNDDIRRYFKKLTLEEVEIVRKVVKYGRVKGWITFIPSFSPKGT